MPRLIILRGNSGSGKSTIAKALFRQSTTRTALIQQDHYRFIFNPPGGGKKPNSDTIHKMIKNDVTIALDDGYDVILEGILGVRSNGKILKALLDYHPKQNFVFYFDIPFNETVRRHASKNTTSFGESDMREWYMPHDLLGVEGEVTIDEGYSVDQTIEQIKRASGI